jgi:hypothetical protein
MNGLLSFKCFGNCSEGVNLTGGLRRKVGRVLVMIMKTKAGNFFKYMKDYPHTKYGLPQNTSHNQQNSYFVDKFVN